MRASLLSRNRRKPDTQKRQKVRWPSSLSWPALKRPFLRPAWTRRRFMHLAAIFFLLAMVWITFNPVHATPISHTQATVNEGCQSLSYSSDGNPFPLCPGGPAPAGGNCVWWAWEEWHLLGYNLPVNWGNAADWIVDAERFGLPVGTVPRAGSIAVFPVADGVWAFGTAGHVAFVTWVSSDSQTFNVTYQNYGDPTPMYTGHGYNVSYINQARFQNGQMRFIYFPKAIDPNLFMKLPGVSSDSSTSIGAANTQLNSIGTSGSLGASRVGLGLPPGAYDQEFSADFSGSGYTDLLLYNRQAGRLDVLALTYPYQNYAPRVLHNQQLNDPQSELHEPYRVSLQDAKTPANGWGPNLEIHLGDFTGSGHTEILLYDRLSGQIQLLLLTPQLSIAKHVTLDGWGAGWELYTGQFDGNHTDLLLYKRFAIPTPLPPTNDGTPGTSNTPSSSNPTSTPHPTKTPNTCKTPTATPTSTPSPTPTKTPSPTPTACKTPTATPTTPAVTPSPTVSPTPTVTPSPTVSPTATAVPNSATTPNAAATPTSTPTTPAVSNISQGAGSQPLGSYSGQIQLSLPTDGSEPVDNKAPDSWNTTGLTADIMLVSLNKDFTVGTTQKYALWHNSWEVYIGRFVNADRDGIFLYDRISGEARLLEYSAKLQLAQFHFLHNLGSNWEVHTGDFSGQGQAQIFLYDPVAGNAQVIILDKKLAVANQVSYSSIGTGLVLYVGHFGLPTLSVMLYDPQHAQSTFMAFDSQLNIAHQALVQTWGPSSQILVGSFLDHALCLEQHTCATGDDILVLNRLSGQVQQYVFSFGNQYDLYDNRVQGFLRDGTASAVSVFPIDASLFSLLTSENSTIHSEELY